jgi:hypothetical protein
VVVCPFGSNGIRVLGQDGGSQSDTSKDIETTIWLVVRPAVGQGLVNMDEHMALRSRTVGLPNKQGDEHCPLQNILVFECALQQPITRVFSR